MKKIEEMTVEELRARRAEIRTELEKPDADLDALEQEAAAISGCGRGRRGAERKPDEGRCQNRPGE